MERDLRDTPLYKEVEAYFAAIYEPGANWVSKGGTVTVSPDGRRAAFTGTVFHDLQSAPVTRVCLVDLASGEMQQVTAAENSDRLPRWSPDGRKLAFLSDRDGAGNFQLYLLQPDGSGAAHAAPVLNGTVEYFHVWGQALSPRCQEYEGRGYLYAGGSARVAGRVPLGGAARVRRSRVQRSVARVRRLVPAGPADGAQAGDRYSPGRRCASDLAG
jgi:dipeptidyl aminopeptidase/acylaminoacyl peptidase